MVSQRKRRMGYDGYESSDYRPPRGRAGGFPCEQVRRRDALDPDRQMRQAGTPGRDASDGRRKVDRRLCHRCGVSFGERREDYAGCLFLRGRHSGQRGGGCSGQRL